MSLELHAFLQTSAFPTRSEWQSAIDRLALPLRLAPELDPATDTGFSPCQLGDRSAGFELFRDSVQELASSYPAIRGLVEPGSVVLSFRWSSELADCACALGAAAALASQFGAAVYSPADDILYQLEDLLAEFRGCLAAL